MDGPGEGVDGGDAVVGERACPGMVVGGMVDGDGLAGIDVGRLVRLKKLDMVVCFAIFFLELYISR